MPHYSSLLTFSGRSSLLVNNKLPGGVANNFSCQDFQNDDLVLRTSFNFNIFITTEKWKYTADNHIIAHGVV